MPLVSISEAARLTGKARSTLHKYIKQGKLSTTTDSENGTTKRIDISELLRVFGNIGTTGSDTVTTAAKLQQTTPNEAHALQIKLQLLEQENTHLKAEKALLAKNLDDVRHAMLLIESKIPEPHSTEQPQESKKTWKFWKQR